jgi:hypothetical protein
MRGIADVRSSTFGGGALASFTFRVQVIQSSAWGERSGGAGLLLQADLFHDHALDGDLPQTSTSDMRTEPF